MKIGNLNTIDVTIHYRNLGEGRYEMRPKKGRGIQTVKTVWKRPDGEVNSEADAFCFLVDWDFKDADGLPIPCTWESKLCMKADVANWLIQEFFARLDDPTTPL